MNFPTPMVGMQLVDKNGKLTAEGVHLLSLLIQPLQQNLSNEGIILPSQNSANITTLNTATSVGRIIFNSTTGKVMINNSGTYQNVLV